MQSVSFSSGISSGSCGDVSTIESPRWLRSTTNQLGSSFPDNWGSPLLMNSSAESANWPKSINMINRLQSTPSNLQQVLPRRSWDGDEFALPPIDLLRLDRSPLEILSKEAYRGNRQVSAQQESDGSPNLKAVWYKGGFGQDKPGNADDQAASLSPPDDEGADFLEWEIRLRLFYIQQLTCLKQEDMKEKMEEMGRQYITLDYQLQVARADLACAFKQRGQLENRLRILDQDKRHLITLIHSNDQAALVQLTKMQEQLKASEKRLEKLAKQVGLQPPASAFARVFLPPCPPEVLNLPDLTRPPPTLRSVHSSIDQSFPAETGTFVFTSLLELAGQLSEMCKGEFGSKLVAERLTRGQEEESRLLWKELGLPASLSSIMASNTSRKVVFALIETWPWAREQLEMEMAKQAIENSEARQRRA